jgi:uncharacterized protein (TIGR02996 family)
VSNRPAQARAMISALVKRDLLEVRRVEIVARDFAAHVEAIDRAPSARELESWLEAHPQITEVSASDDALEAALGEFLAPPKPAPTTMRHPELERAIYQDEDPERAIAVYADWLQQHNDPFGDQLALGLTGDVERFARYVRDHAERILGEHWREFATLRLDWRNGLIDKLSDFRGLSSDHRQVAPEHWAALLRTRSCEMIREIQLHRPFDDELDAAIAEHAPPGLMSVILHHHSEPKVPRLAARPFYNLTLGGNTFELSPDSLSPRLEQLQLSVDNLILQEPIVWNVRRIHLLRTTPRLASALAQIALPKLERLTVAGDPSLFEDFPAYVRS